MENDSFLSGIVLGLNTVCSAVGGKKVSLVKQLRAETKCAVTWLYDSCVPFCLQIELRFKEWVVS